MSKRKSIRLDEFDVFGFDIDHTLAKYKIDNLFQDLYDSMAAYLVQKKGYPKEIFHFDKDFCTRGLILDVKSGNFIKVAENGHIFRASHGSRAMTMTEMKRTFGETLSWTYFHEIITCTENLGDKFCIFEHFFDMPAAALCADVIDWIDSKDNPPAEYSYWPDIIAAINNVYRPDEFEANKGDTFVSWKKNIDRYVHKCSDQVKNWLRLLKKKNKKLFVLSSSYEDLIRTVLPFILGDDYETYFDLFISLSKKPGFFINNRNFSKIDTTQETGEIDVFELKAGEFYLGGNNVVLTRFLQQQTGKNDPKVIFFGDSLLSDVFPSKYYASWSSVLILEELIYDQPPSCTAFNPLKEKDTTLKSAEECLMSRRWGSLFTDNLPGGGQTQNKMNTMWGYMIRLYADLVIPQLDHITYLDLNHQLNTFHEEDPLVLGFYPYTPHSLQI